MQKLFKKRFDAYQNGSYTPKKVNLADAEK
jgi:hypothetical protein